MRVLGDSARQLAEAPVKGFGRWNGRILLLPRAAAMDQWTAFVFGTRRIPGQELQKRASTALPDRIAGLTSMPISLRARWMNLIVLQGLTQSCTCFVENPYYRSTLIQRLRWPVFPHGAGGVYGNVVPDDAAAVMLTHGVRNQPTLVPELCGAIA